MIITVLYHIVGTFNISYSTNFLPNSIAIASFSETSKVYGGENYGSNAKVFFFMNNDICSWHATLHPQYTGSKKDKSLVVGEFLSDTPCIRLHQTSFGVSECTSGLYNEWLAVGYRRIKSMLLSSQTSRLPISWPIWGHRRPVEFWTRSRTVDHVYVAWDL